MVDPSVFTSTASVVLHPFLLFWIITVVSTGLIRLGFRKTQGDRGGQSGPLTFSAVGTNEQRGRMFRADRGGIGGAQDSERLSGGCVQRMTVHRSSPDRGRSSSIGLF